MTVCLTPFTKRNIYLTRHSMPKLASKLILLLLLATAPFFRATAQKPAPPARCQIGRNAAPVGFWTWPAGAQVKVYVRTKDFRPEELPYVLAPLQNWTSLSELTGSGVKFEYAGTTDERLTCERCLTILRGPVFDKTKRHVTETQAYSIHRDQLIAYGAIVIDPSLTNLQALSNAVSHELGHNLGLLDCYSCKRDTTVMNGFKGLNVPNALEMPSACDVAQVREAYAELKIRVRPSPLAARIDQGEEPVDDDTPIVVPKP